MPMTLTEFTDLLTQKCGLTIDDPTLPFASCGVDSLTLLDILVAVEDTYRIDIDPAMLADGRLGNAADLHAFAEATRVSADK
ncbi:acyl carrier protein [Devriesea agamarum]|uniref:acyl carrier protein n=1 Tax=Devriesea agamarum TaxID=472569 RepID=UPI00071E1A89|nr:acyl carrier protein [Devriesea agamarum]